MHKLHFCKFYQNIIFKDGLHTIKLNLTLYFQLKQCFSAIVNALISSNVNFRQVLAQAFQVFLITSIVVNLRNSVSNKIRAIFQTRCICILFLKCRVLIFYFIETVNTQNIQFRALMTQLVYFFIDNVMDFLSLM